MIAIKPFTGINQAGGVSGKTYEQSCDVIGVDYRDGEYVLITLVREDGIAFVKAVDYVDLPPPSNQPYYE